MSFHVCVVSFNTGTLQVPCWVTATTCVSCYQGQRWSTAILNKASSFCYTLFQQHHMVEHVPVRLHGQTCRWQMVSREIRGESSPLAELTLKVSGRLRSQSQHSPAGRARGWTSSLHGLRKFNYSLMKSELTSPHHPSSSFPPPPPAPTLPPLTQLKLIMEYSSARLQV